MNVNIAKWILQNEAGVCSATTLLEHSGLSADELHALIDNGVILPVDEKVTPPVFRLPALVLARKARRLRDDFELDQNGLVLALTLIRRIEQLEQELQRVHAGLHGDLPETNSLPEAGKAADLKAGPAPGIKNLREATTANATHAHRSSIHY